MYLMMCYTESKDKLFCRGNRDPCLCYLERYECVIKQAFARSDSTERPPSRARRCKGHQIDNRIERRFTNDRPHH